MGAPKHGGSKGRHHETAFYTLTHEFEPDAGGTCMTLRVQVHDAPLYGRMIDHFEGGSADRMVQNRLHAPANDRKKWRCLVPGRRI